MCQRKYQSMCLSDLCLCLELDFNLDLGIDLVSSYHHRLSLSCPILPYLTLHSPSHSVDQIRSLCDYFHSKQ